MPQLRQPFSSWSKRMSAWMSAKMASSFSRGTGGVSDTGSPMNSCTRVAACSMSPPGPLAGPQRSVGEDLRVALHHFLDQVRAAHDAGALRDEVVLAHVEQVEVGRAAVELHAGLVRVLDEVVHGLRRAFL